MSIFYHTNGILFQKTCQKASKIFVKKFCENFQETVKMSRRQLHSSTYWARTKIYKSPGMNTFIINQGDIFLNECKSQEIKWQKHDTTHDQGKISLQQISSTKFWHNSFLSLCGEELVPAVTKHTWAIEAPKKAVLWQSAMKENNKVLKWKKGNGLLFQRNNKHILQMHTWSVLHSIFPPKNARIPTQI